MDNEDVVPGVTFRLETSTVTGTPSPRYIKAKGRVVLSADIADEGIWDQTIQRLDGLKVYADDDFYTQILNALRMENQDLEIKLARQTEVARVEIERAAQALEIADQVMVGLRAQIAERDVELTVHRAADREMEELATLLTVNLDGTIKR